MRFALITVALNVMADWSAPRDDFQEALLKHRRNHRVI
jgi:hypothetical protein